MGGIYSYEVKISVSVERRHTKYFFQAQTDTFQSWQHIHLHLHKKNHRVFWAEIHSSDLECILN